MSDTNPTKEQQNEPGYTVRYNKEGAWWSLDGINWYPLKEYYHEEGEIMTTNCKIGDHTNCGVPAQCDCDCHDWEVIMPNPKEEIDGILEELLSSRDRNWNRKYNSKREATAKLCRIVEEAKYNELQRCLLAEPKGEKPDFVSQMLAVATYVTERINELEANLDKQEEG